MKLVMLDLVKLLRLLIVHTTTYGGAGCFCTGIGTAEMAAALITGELWFKVPNAIKIVLNGHLPKGVLSKDVILKILGDIKADGGQYKSSGIYWSRLLMK